MAFVTPNASMRKSCGAPELNTNDEHSQETFLAEQYVVRKDRREWATKYITRRVRYVQPQPPLSSIFASCTTSIQLHTARYLLVFCKWLSPPRRDRRRSEQSRASTNCRMEWGRLSFVPPRLLPVRSASVTNNNNIGAHGDAVGVAAKHESKVRRGGKQKARLTQSESMGLRDIYEFYVRGG